MLELREEDAADELHRADESPDRGRGREVISARHEIRHEVDEDADAQREAEEPEREPAKARVAQRFEEIEVHLAVVVLVRRCAPQHEGVERDGRDREDHRKQDKRTAPPEERQEVRGEREEDRAREPSHERHHEQRFGAPLAEERGHGRERRRVQRA